ncbi:hypothetical protein BS47DRAFT_1399234 [Hydnum rufescens UP504]|uniref:Uncharacterized protein n=1 Tax=Hydnum rufescens UP504 TaxID=1448309 RepID=A0A9P6DPW4_9AGAM|nr:hypothetical protein BS47DRAFT_1399234 [Hydnum rufescens UP504]
MTTELFILSQVPAAHPVHLLLYPKQKSLMETHLQGLYTFLSCLTVHASEVWALPDNETEASLPITFSLTSGTLENKFRKYQHSSEDWIHLPAPVPSIPSTSNKCQRSPTPLEAPSKQLKDDSLSVDAMDIDDSSNTKDGSAMDVDDPQSDPLPIPTTSGTSKIINISDEESNPSSYHSDINDAPNNALEPAGPIFSGQALHCKIGGTGLDISLVQFYFILVDSQS